MSAAAGERPILFSGPMVRVILAGKKTMTRRILRMPPSLAGADLDVAWPDAALWGGAGNGGLHVQFGDASHRVRCPYGQPGDALWVRETFCFVDPDGDPTDMTDRGHVGVCYAATDEFPRGVRTRPSIFMPRWASRLTLRVTSVRVERLHEITEADAQAEGVVTPRPVAAFTALWDGINGDRAAWASNPWVWVVSFERVTP